MGLGDWPDPFYDLGATGQWNDLQSDNTLFYFRRVRRQIRPEAGHRRAGARRSLFRYQHGAWVGSLHRRRRYKIEVFIDDEYLFDLPHGGPHSKR